MNNDKRKICYVVEAASAGVGRHVADLIERENWLSEGVFKLSDSINNK